MWKKPIVLLITLLLAILGVTAVQVAANNAGPGDEIVVGEGSYRESVNVNNMGSVGQTQAAGPGELQWAKQAGGTAWDGGNGIATDGDGNGLVTG